MSTDKTRHNSDDRHDQYPLEPQVGAEEFIKRVLSQVGDRDAKVFLEYSGGHDSTALLYAVAHSDEIDIDAVVHLNTGIGAEFTREYVREHCATLDQRYIEVQQPDRSQRYGPKYIKYGCPGARPIAHEMMRRDLKQDPEDHLIAGFDDDIIIITGVSRYESPRRHRTVAQSGIQESSRHSNVTYVAPFAELTGSEIREQLEKYDVERNELADLMDSSGECLCAAFAQFWDLAYVWEYEPWLAVGIVNLILLAEQYWAAYREEHGQPPYPRQYLIWGHGGVGRGALSEMVQGSLDDPDDFKQPEIEARAEDAEEDDDQLDLSDKCASCNRWDEVTHA